MNDGAVRSEDAAKIASRFGDGFLDRVQRNLAACANRWGLTDIRLIPSFSANVVFTCHAEKHGDAVLKLAPSPDWLFKEYHTLREYAGRRFCKLYAADPDEGILLEERIRPGAPLRDEPSAERRAEVFCGLFRDLHLASAEAELYLTYTDWVNNITKYMRTRPEFTELLIHMERALRVHLDVTGGYRRQLLLHGDFHHDNILLGADGTYRLIDPKGVVGDPVCDIPRFILNEFGEYADENGDDVYDDNQYRHINLIIGILSERLEIPQTVIRQCLYVETVMANCWMVEDGSTPQEQLKLLEPIRFAEALMSR